jgi:CheY-like chemotaxis protein
MVIGLSVMSAAPIYRPLRVLVADDCPDTRASLRLLISFWGHGVRTVADGELAVRAAAQFRPDVALLDVEMPRLDGYAAARRLRDDPATAHTILVAVMSAGDFFHFRKADAAGFHFRLFKPCDPALLRLLFDTVKRTLAATDLLGGEEDR